LDIAISGGFPAGSVIEIIGREGLGKTALAYRTLGMYQRKRGSAANIFTVHLETFDKVFARMMGFVVPMSPTEIEEEEVHQNRKLTNDERKELERSVGTVMEIRGGGPDVLNGVIDCVASNMFGLGMLDSIGSILSDEEKKLDDVSDKTYGGVSHEMTTLQKKWRALTSLPDEYGNPNCTTLILINQYRQEIGGYGGMRTTGGNALKHLKDISIRLDQEANAGKSADTQGNTFWKDIKWTITKGKQGCHDGDSGSYRFVFPQRTGINLLSIDNTGGPHLALNLANMAVRYDVVEKSGSWYILPEEDVTITSDAYKDSTALVRIQGLDKLAELLVLNQDLYEMVLSRMFRQAKVRDYRKYDYRLKQQVEVKKGDKPDEAKKQKRTRLKKDA
jgi:RecA/RadA recombinase